MPDQAFQLLNLALAVVNFVVATILVVRGVVVNREIGAAKVTAAAQDAYEDLLDTRDAAVSPEQAERFYDRFWAGQILQYEQWRRGLIPDLVYTDWLLRRRQQFADDRVIAGVSFRDAWRRRHDERYHDTRFGRLMSGVAAGALAGEAGRDAIKVVRVEMRRARRWL